MLCIAEIKPNSDFPNHQLLNLKGVQKLNRGGFLVQQVFIVKDIKFKFSMQNQ